MSALYRVQQFAQAALAIVRPDRHGAQIAARHLSPDALALFRAMPRYDRRHALAVARSLLADGFDNPHLIAAALLHDAGKTAGPTGRVTLVHRVLVVLARAFAPRLLERLGREPAPGRTVPRWRRTFYTQCHHAAIGAQLARQAGCSPETIALIHRHESRAEVADPLLSALQAADSTN